MSPYRAPSKLTTEPTGNDAYPDADLVPVFAIVWAVSTARVWIALSGHEGASTETTAAFVCVVGSPFLFRDWAIEWWRRRFERSGTPLHASRKRTDTKQKQSGVKK